MWDVFHLIVIEVHKFVFVCDMWQDVKLISLLHEWWELICKTVRKLKLAMVAVPLYDCKNLIQKRNPSHLLIDFWQMLFCFVLRVWQDTVLLN